MVVVEEQHVVGVGCVEGGSSVARSWIRSSSSKFSSSTTVVPAPLAVLSAERYVYLVRTSGRTVHLTSVDMTVMRR